MLGAEWWLPKRYISSSVVSTLCGLMDCMEPTRLLCPWDFRSKNIGVGCYFLLQGSFPTQGSNLSFLQCWQILYRLTHQGSPQKIQLKKEKQVIKRWPELAPSFPLNHLVNTRWTKQLLKQGLHSGGWWSDLPSQDEQSSRPFFPLKTSMAEQNLRPRFWGNTESAISPDH